MNRSDADDGQDEGTAHRQRLNPECAAAVFILAEATVTTFGQLLILTDADGRLAEIAIVTTHRDSDDVRKTGTRLNLAPMGYRDWRRSKRIKEI